MIFKPNCSERAQKHGVSHDFQINSTGWSDNDTRRGAVLAGLLLVLATLNWIVPAARRLMLQTQLTGHGMIRVRVSHSNQLGAHT